MTSLTIITWLAALGGALGVLHLAALAAERRGWIYYRNHPPPPGAAARAANTLAAFVHPETAHVREAEAPPAPDEHDGS